MTTHLTIQNHPYFDFSKPIDPQAIAGEDQLLSDLVATPALKRLQSIRFLGGIDYVLIRSPNGAKGNVRYTRYQHSLGVTRLAINYSRERNLSSTDRRLICAAALLHDIGHAPLSHSLEPAFENMFGLEHHRATEDVIRGRSPIGNEICHILHHYRVDVEHLVAIISGQELAYDGFFSGPINFDTIEGILRSQAFLRPSPSNQCPEAVATAALRREDTRDRRIVDDFWHSKDWIYRHVINSRAGILADYACQLFMRRNPENIKASDYFGSEDQIFRKLPGLLQLLTSPSFESDIFKLLDAPITFSSRRYFVDQDTDFFARRDLQRYRQERRQQLLYPSANPEFERGQ